LINQSPADEVGANAFHHRQMELKPMTVSVDQSIIGISIRQNSADRSGEGWQMEPLKFYRWSRCKILVETIVKIFSFLDRASVRIKVSPASSGNCPYYIGINIVRIYMLCVEKEQGKERFVGSRMRRRKKGVVSRALMMFFFFFFFFSSSPIYPLEPTQYPMLQPQRQKNSADIHIARAKPAAMQIKANHKRNLKRKKKRCQIISSLKHFVAETSRHFSFLIISRSRNLS
jgi:hypothetical protein